MTDSVLTSADGTTGKDTPRLLSQCFNALFHSLLDESVRISVTIELFSKGLISNQAKSEATQVAGDPQQKALIVVDDIYLQCTTSLMKLLIIARALSQIPAVNSIGSGMETLYWRFVVSSGNIDLHYS